MSEVAERYLWTPWDVGSDGTNTWPSDFHSIQDSYKAATSRRSTQNVHSLKGIGRLVVIEGPSAYIADHMTVPGVVDLGDTLTSARGWVEADASGRAKEFLAHFEKVLAPKRKQNPRDKSALLTRFLPDQLRKRGPAWKRGTETENFTGTDGDAYPSTVTATEMDTLDFVTSGGTFTLEIFNNAASAVGFVGGPLRIRGYTVAYNGITSTDIDAHALVSAGGGGRLLGVCNKIEVGDGFDSFYFAESRDQSGDDTRLFKIVDETRTEEASSGALAIGYPHHGRLVSTNDGSGDPALQYRAWSGTEPGAWLIEHTDTEVDALDGTGHGGFYFTVGRDDSHVFEYDLIEVTDNDTPGGAPRVRRNFGLLGVGR